SEVPCACNSAGLSVSASRTAATRRIMLTLLRSSADSVPMQPCAPATYESGSPVTIFAGAGRRNAPKSAQIALLRKKEQKVVPVWRLFVLVQHVLPETDVPWMR